MSTSSLNIDTLLLFPSPKRRQIVRHVRHDPEFDPQLYFVTTEDEHGRLLLSFEQAVWDKKRNHISSHVFSKHHIIARSGTTLHCAVDEKRKTIYIVYASGKELAVAVQRLHLKYKKPDKWGYRRMSVTVRDKPIGWKLGLNDEEARIVDVSVTAISFCPSTAQLVLYCKYAMADGDIGFLPRRRNVTPSKLSLLNAAQSKVMEARSIVSSPSNDLLALISFRSREPPVDKGATNGCMILYSYNPKLQLVNTLKIDPVHLLQSFLHNTELDSLKTGSSMPDFMFFGSHLQLLGHVHKYVLFFFHPNYFLAAKWPKNWYKLKRLPEVQDCLYMSVDCEKLGQILDAWLVSTEIYIRFEKCGVEAIARLDMDQNDFKGYRTCAFCGEEERRKKKNKDGKRVSSFKVCRLCKELILHKNYSRDCHYCSFECVRKDWKKHKLVHNGRKRDTVGVSFGVQTDL